MFFEKNITVLRKVNPGLALALLNREAISNPEILHAKNGMPSLKVDSIALHSLYDPVKEAEDWVKHHEQKIQDSSSIFVLGFGLGYHIVELCKNTDGELIVFEPRLDVLEAALETFCLTSILARVRIVTDLKQFSFVKKGNTPLTPSPLERGAGVCNRGELSPPLGKGDTGGFYNNNIAILEHKPSVKLNPEYFKKVTAIKSLEKINRGIKILVVGPVYGGSLPIAGYCSSTLRKMGHTVELMDNSRFSDALFFADEVTKDRARYKRLVEILTAFLSEAVIARCEAFKPRLVFALAQAPLNAECLEILRANKIPTAFWFVEDFRVMGYWRKIARSYDYFFTIQKGDFFEELKKEGVKNYHYLPLAASHDEHRENKLNEEEKEHYGSDVSFVGAGYYNRRHFFRGLLDLDFKIWGNGWPQDQGYAKYIQRGGQRIETEETVKIFNASEININLHSSTYHKGINPFGDFVNPRTFEIASCGAFQLTDRRKELEELFDLGEEIVVFEDLEDLRLKISYYLEHSEERKTIAEKARQRVLKEHTYEHRMRELLEFLAACGYEPPVWKEEGESVHELIDEAGSEGELAEYLSKFAGKGRITLSDIIKEIENGEGDISRTESIFLLMNELVKK
ncbi:MAG: glycosyltransferase [Nitrospirae bacterium]|nr:glycosyltransferase [Nitrospirota bacterium]